MLVQSAKYGLFSSCLLALAHFTPTQVLAHFLDALVLVCERSAITEDSILTRTIVKILFATKSPSSEVLSRVTSKREMEKTMELPEDHPSSFGHLVTWLYTSIISCNAYCCSSKAPVEAGQSVETLTPIDHRFEW